MSDRITDLPGQPGRWSEQMEGPDGVWKQCRKSE
jgi:hypothetical protein